MYVNLVSINIKPEHKKAFMAAMIENARDSMKNEPGCLRFDIVELKDNPNQLILYEIYITEKSLDDHRNYPHFIKWRDTVKDMFASERTRTAGETVYPPDSAWKKYG